ncbi:MAG: isoprenyl transferase [Bacteroidales bacterium]|nr:isoprenyl transferase [Bacteroidales bacterium]MDY0285558.1 isoprenyl transferase [Bacteroidales bacterium]
MELKNKIDLQRLPRHVAIIMDGNGRWALQQGQSRTFGHEKGVIPVKECAEAAAELGIRYLTLYAFSTENWNRPKEEVTALMGLLVETINQEVETLQKNKIRLKAIGDLNSLEEKPQQKLQEAIETTANNEGLTLVLALSYSSRWEIVEAVKKLTADVQKGRLKPEDINENMLCNYLETKDIPDPELLIRTSGELRISNFLLWQIAYSELFFTPKLWPEIRKNDFFEAIIDFQHRERRFGKTSEQLANKNS